MLAVLPRVLAVVRPGDDKVAALLGGWAAKCACAPTPISAWENR
jgi:hypothetical protein